MNPCSKSIEPGEGYRAVHPLQMQPVGSHGFTCALLTSSPPPLLSPQRQDGLDSLELRRIPPLAKVCMACILPPDRRPVVISGPSGVGKSTLSQRLLDAHPGTFATTVSHTTRKPRPGEIEGTTYYYVSRDKFESLIAEDTFIEYTEFNGNLYGTSKQTVIDQTAKGSFVLLDIEMEGVKQLKTEQLKADSQINPRFVFIKPPNFTVLEVRLRGRGTEDECSI
ncbi:P-loop containing nucleoside triphosphate hydrolase protein [Diplogelasinospora grovesii]|uniref:P-loop containing nucleoside triphosphate hydrolase protein n=1 Tax=Diplogelasinospora grovesii TaxID=303347 RepID=A0AAN6NAI7_9PEZI|nr:P-loop containing nucleoside triphosphate hydrolase protein [Diplogelasinospora grovesii]